MKTPSPTEVTISGVDALASTPTFACGDCGADLEDAEPTILVIDTGEVQITLACSECDNEHVAHVPIEYFVSEVGP